VGCLLALIAAFSPRLALFLIWIFTNLVSRAFDTFIVPLLGFLLLPFTTLMYVLVYQPVTGVTGFGWLLVIVGFLIDLGAYGGVYGRRSRSAR
jgi:hypothetical protein